MIAYAEHQKNTKLSYFRFEKIEMKDHPTKDIFRPKRKRSAEISDFRFRGRRVPCTLSEEPRKTMVVRYDIPEQLSPYWRPRLREQLNLSLSPVRSSLRSASVRFRRVSDPRTATEHVECHLRSRSLSGTTYDFVARHADGITAISDVCSRVRRRVVRSRRNQAFSV